MTEGLLYTQPVLSIPSTNEHVVAAVLKKFHNQMKLINDHEKADEMGFSIRMPNRRR
jgi:hypothetical protein